MVKILRKVMDHVVPTITWLIGWPDPYPTDQWYRELAHRHATPGRRVTKLLPSPETGNK